MISQEHINQLKELLGPGKWSDDPDVLEPHLREWRDKYFGKTPLLLLPACTEDVSCIVKYCHDNRLPLVPQGGNTGLVGGGLPDQDGSELLISLKKMNKTLELDQENASITVQSGAILADIQKMADDHDFLFPVSLASEGSCQIGGIISTNAGGINVLKYGSTRDQVLGLEVILPTGEIWNGLTGLRKDNTGYDLKQVFMGAEGTLGIITSATLKLFPAVKETQTAFVAVADVAAAVQLLKTAQKQTGGLLTAFELMPRIGIQMVIDHMAGNRDPLQQAYDWYVLMECGTSLDRSLLDMDQMMEQVMVDGMEQGLILDGVIAKNMTEHKALWALRENMSEAQKFEGGSIKHDVSLPISRIDDFMDQAIKAVATAIPGIRPVPFGHLGDGNIHFNLTQPEGADKTAYLDRWEEINRLVHDIVVDMGGSISAEHGIGIMKVDELENYKSKTELDLMRRIKKTLDPHNIMNPGRIIK